MTAISNFSPLHMMTERGAGASEGPGVCIDKHRGQEAHLGPNGLHKEVQLKERNHDHGDLDNLALVYESDEAGVKVQALAAEMLGRPIETELDLVELVIEYYKEHGAPIPGIFVSCLNCKHTLGLKGPPTEVELALDFLDRKQSISATKKMKNQIGWEMPKVKTALANLLAAEGLQYNEALKDFLDLSEKDVLKAAEKLMGDMNFKAEVLAQMIFDFTAKQNETGEDYNDGIGAFLIEFQENK